MPGGDGVASLSSVMASLSVHSDPANSSASSNNHSSNTSSVTRSPYPSHTPHAPASVASATPQPQSPAALPVPTFPPLQPSASVRECLLRFLAVQEQRALTYSAWQSAFRHYVASKAESDLHAFTAHCQQATIAFQQLSLQVKLCAAHLQSLHSEWADELQAVQRLEKEKLGLTVAMQELTSEWVIGKKQEFSSELQAQLLVRRQRMDELVGKINDIMTEARYFVHYKKKS